MSPDGIADETERKGTWPRPQRLRIGIFNGRGTWTLFRREIRRAIKVWDFTIAAATIRAVLVTIVFGLAAAGVDRLMGGLALLDFLIPGLIAAAVLEHAFVAPAFSMVHDRVEGILGDVVVSPLTVVEIMIAYTAAALAGSVAVGVFVWLALLPFGAPLPHDPAAVLGFAAAGAVMIGFVSAMVGLVLRRWDSLAAVQTFVVLPFVFMSGVFFSLDRLPSALAEIAGFNPLLYVVDGIRFGLTGVAETDLATGAAVVVAAIILLGGVCYRMFAAGLELRN